MSAITSHVLDTALGRPAANLRISLSMLAPSGDWQELAERSTDADGRVRDLLPEASLPLGTYRLTFDTGAYLRATHQTSFYPHVQVVFTVDDAVRHYHVPLLLSPYGYSTYRGS